MSIEQFFIMDLRVFFDEVFVELPNEYYADFDFDVDITALTISHLGHFLGVGFADGDIVLCDSESGNNRHKYTGHKAEITALSFSIDNRLIASGDNEGHFQITEVLTHNIIYQDTAKEGIKNIIFNPSSNEEFLVQSGNKVSVINLTTKESRILPDDVSIILWNDKYGFIVINEHLELNFYDDQFNRKGHSTMNYMKKIVFACISTNGKLLVLINSRGEGIMYNTDDLATTEEEEPEYREMYKDRVTETKYTCCIFDRNNEHVIFSSNQKKQCKLVIFELDNPEVKQELDGPSEPVDFLLFHPQQPVVYSCGSPSIRMWTPTYENSWEQFYPGFQHLETNVEYIEREDEFDIDDAVHVDNIYREPGETIDIFTPVQEEPQILVDLPLDIDELVSQRIEKLKNAKKETKEEETH